MVGPYWTLASRFPGDVEQKDLFSWNASVALTSYWQLQSPSDNQPNYGNKERNIVDKIPMQSVLLDKTNETKRLKLHGHESKKMEPR